MKDNFKIGDEVVCIEPYDGLLIKNRVYKVKDAYNNGQNGVYLEGVETGFFSNRFELLNEIQTEVNNSHYDNSKGSIYQFCDNQNLNSYEFDIIKRVTRCRKKGSFREDLEKTKILIDLYLLEHEETNRLNP